nr:MAG TPA: hypothetical protein [Caudoviricetes sp.]
MLISIFKVIHQCGYLLFLIRHTCLLTRVTN